jgi:putative DNA primase/helicase
LETLRLKYRRTKSGEIWVHKFAGEKSVEGSGEKVAIWTPVSSPFGVSALPRMADADDAYGLRVSMPDMSGQPRAVDFNRAELARFGAGEIRARLLEAGLRVENDGESVVVQVLKAAKPFKCIIVFSRPGWHRLPEPVFVTPAGETIAAPDDVPIELAASVKLSDRVSRSGTIEGWQAAVRAAVTAENSPHWTLSAAGGFAGVVVDLIKLDTCGLNQSGETSIGKTTGQQMAVSAWSSPKQSDGGLLKTMRATENAVEALARDSSGTILALDELAHTDGRVIGRLLYSLAGDVGKSRMGPDGSLRQPHTWSTFVLLSGEKSLEQKIRDDGGQWTGGMATRFPDVDVTGVNSRVAPETIDALKQIFRHYGNAGPAFVRALIANGLHLEPDLLKERVFIVARTLAGSAATSAKVPAAVPFAIVAIADNLAQEFGIFPSEADVAGAIRPAWERLCSSSDALALDPERQVVIKIRQYIAERWAVRIKAVRSETGITTARRPAGTITIPSICRPTGSLRPLGVSSRSSASRLCSTREGICLAAAVCPGSRSDGCPGSAMSVAMRCGVASSVDPTRKPTPTSYTR